MAQMVEQLIRNQQVRGSSPLVSSNLTPLGVFFYTLLSDNLGLLARDSIGI